MRIILRSTGFEAANSPSHFAAVECVTSHRLSAHLPANSRDESSLGNDQVKWNFEVALSLLVCGKSAALQPAG